MWKAIIRDNIKKNKLNLYYPYLPIYIKLAICKKYANLVFHDLGDQTTLTRVRGLILFTIASHPGDCCPASLSISQGLVKLDQRWSKKPKFWPQVTFEFPIELYLIRKLLMRKKSSLGFFFAIFMVTLPKRWSKWPKSDISKKKYHFPFIYQTNGI